ncbi:MAG: hypothetical protein OSJ38_03455 [Lachnospiraceae bacterium]|nr:hypothetical protein [Lachnospiraceae bacterium]MCX4346289.1 hypothetical protein [Lachnospiraceae bacterium]
MPGKVRSEPGGCEPVMSIWYGKSLPSCAAECPVSRAGIRRYTDNV